MLSFKPRFHMQIAEGEFSGSWARVGQIPTSHHLFRDVKSDMFAKEPFEEMVRIQNEGGSIFVIDPKADPGTLQELNGVSLVAYCGT